MSNYIIKVSNNMDDTVKVVQKRTIDEVNDFIKTLIERHQKDRYCLINKRTEFDCEIIHPVDDIVYECHTLKV